MSQRIPAILVLVAFVLAGSASPRAASAIGLGDLKKKAKEKAQEEAGKKIGDAPAPAKAAASEGDKADDAKGGDAKGDAGSAEVSKVSTKFDFVPGDKVILMDDFTRDELGEFPSRWRLLNGNFDIAEFKGERWLRQNGTDGIIAIKGTSLPAKWTLEFDMDQKVMGQWCITVGGMFAGSSSLDWHAMLADETVYFQGPGGAQSTATMPGGMSGRHHVSLMGNGTGLKLYVDRERLVNIPEMEMSSPIVNLAFRLWKTNEYDPMITNVRLAEGGKPKVDLLTAPFVTHGINFATGSDRVLPSSAPVLRQIAAYLKENATVKVMVTGHTDDVGETAANQILSQKRAQAVVASLVGDFGIEGARLAASGKGESVPMASNASLEGKAMNRRVEFSKQK